MENYEINDVVENVVEVGEELAPELVTESTGLAKAGYVGLGALIGVGAALLANLAKKKWNERKAKKKAKASKDKEITEEKIEEIPGEENEE